MKLLVVSTPLGPLGSGRGGGVELTLAGLVAGLLQHFSVLCQALSGVLLF